MNFYSLDKQARIRLVEKINLEISEDFNKGRNSHLINYFSDEDTYIRKTAYLAIGKIYKSVKHQQVKILHELKKLLNFENEKVRQTTINAAGEIGIINFSVVEELMEIGLFDEHPSVRNAVIGSIKKMSEKNPVPVLIFAKRFLKHPEKEIRREICHGIELRGRTHPEDILPLLRVLEFDKTARVRNTLIHVLGQIAYKKGCLQKVVEDLKLWDNKELAEQALIEIIDVHDRYKNFSYLTTKEANDYIQKHF